MFLTCNIYMVLLLIVDFAFKFHYRLSRRLIDQFRSKIPAAICLDFFHFHFYDILHGRDNIEFSKD